MNGPKFASRYRMKRVYHTSSIYFGNADENINTVINGCHGRVEGCFDTPFRISYIYVYKSNQQEAKILSSFIQ